MDIIPYLAPIATFSAGAVSTIVGGLLTSMFLRGNTQTMEYEKIKAGKYAEVLSTLLCEGKMTYFELYKCNNFLSVAKKADEINKENQKQNKTVDNPSNEFDIDWFMRFFECVGNISNEDMQKLWAKVLSGEINNPGKFSPRAMECLRNMRADEANMFLRMSSMVFKTDCDNKYSHFFIPVLHIDSEDYNKVYSVANVDINRMIEVGVLSPIVGYLKLPKQVDDSVIIAQIKNQSIVCEKTKETAIPTVINTRLLTEVGNQLLNTINLQQDAIFLSLTINHWRKNQSMKFTLINRE